MDPGVSPAPQELGQRDQNSTGKGEEGLVGSREGAVDRVTRPGG